MSEIAILGTGAWGTALAIQAARAGTDLFSLAAIPRALRRSRWHGRTRGCPA